jgi:hypothetical protein
MENAYGDSESLSIIELLVEALLKENEAGACIAASNEAACDSVPGAEFRSIEDASFPGCSNQPFSTDVTTVMIRNIPRKCSQRMLLGDIVAAGFGEVLDFVYLPTDISLAKNLGYAFVNFVHPAYAKSFRDIFHKKHLPCMRGSRTGLSVSPAVIQGFNANVDNVMKNASVHRIRNPEYLPLVLNRQTGRLAPCLMEMDIKRRHSQGSVASTASSSSQSPKVWNRNRSPEVTLATDRFLNF